MPRKFPRLHYSPPAQPGGRGHRVVVDRTRGPA